MPVVVASGKQTVSLRHFFLGKFCSKLLFLSLAQDRQRHVGAIGESLQELSQLTRLDQNLVVQHFENVILLNAGRSGGTVRLDVIDNQSQAFRQTKLVTNDRRHLRCLHTQICYRDLWRFLVMTWHSRRMRRETRARRGLGGWGGGGLLRRRRGESCPA